MPAVPALSVRDLRKTYGNGVEALKGVTLDVAEVDSSPCSARTAPASRP
jgi:ABC-type histidine transport system ATPase subunit